MRHIQENGMGDGKYGTIEEPKSKTAVDTLRKGIDKRHVSGASKSWKVQGEEIRSNFPIIL